ncbi:MAG TPA: carboxymuconolactone decarboxylase family protein [Chryseolinea sp.]
MEKRIKMNSLAPDGYKVMLAFEKYLNGTSLSDVHKNLIRIRASQINGCSYCVDMHTQEAREAGESERRIYNLASWRETPFFSDDERAILALTEEVTLITQRLSDQTYLNAVSLLGEKYVAEAIFAIITINGWNRIGVATNMAPEYQEESAHVVK